MAKGKAEGRVMGISVEASDDDSPAGVADVMEAREDDDKRDAFLERGLEKAIDATRRGVGAARRGGDDERGRG